MEIPGPAAEFADPVDLEEVVGLSPAMRWYIPIQADDTAGRDTGWSNCRNREGAAPGPS